MGYINVQRNLGGGGSSTYIAEKVKIKETVEAPEISKLSLALTPYDSGNPPTMSSDFVAGPFTFTAKGYYIPPTTLWSNYSTITSFECITKYKFTSMPTDLETVMAWERLFGWEYKADGCIGIWNYTLAQYAYEGTTPVTVDTWYWMKVQIDSSRTVTYSLSTDGENYTQLVSFTDNNYSWSNIYSNTKLGFGYHVWIPAETREFDCGVIDFKGTSIKINGNDIFYYTYQPYHKYYDNTEGDN